MAETEIGHNPREISRYTFLELLTDAEKVQIEIAQMQATPDAADPNLQLRVLYSTLMSTPTVNLDEPKVAQGMALLQALGILTPERAGQVLAGEVPGAP